MPRLWANNILKVNRSQLQKRKIRKLRDMLESDFKNNELVFPEISTKDLEEVKSRIREQAKKDFKKRIVIDLGIFALTLFLLWLCYYWIFL